MLRNQHRVAAALIIFTCSSCLCFSQSAEQEKTQNSKLIKTDRDREKESWQTFSKNEWYELAEFKINETDSLVRMTLKKTDAQLGIGVAMDVAVLAHSREFKFFKIAHRLSKKELSISKKNALANGGNDHFKVTFLKEKPTDDSKNVMDVKPWVWLMKQKDAVKGKRKSQKEGKKKQGHQ